MPIEAIARLLLKVLPDRLSLSVIRALATTQRPPVRPDQQQALDQATMLHYGDGGRHVAWAWGNGPLVILVHGWNGRAAQLAPLALHIAALGFRCVAIDVTGHGSSPGKRTAWSCFIDDINSLTRSLGGDVHAYIGHSAGGLTMMAARQLKGIQARRYACICAPSYPAPPIAVVKKRLNPRPGTLVLYQDYIARQFDMTWEVLKSGVSYADAGPDLLLIYDESDKFVAHTEGDRIHGLCHGSRLIKTRNHGHTKILVAPELMNALAEFLGNGNSIALERERHPAPASAAPDSSEYLRAN
jgi:pimeloyl-ACP methyl ester carboxylesterase